MAYTGVAIFALFFGLSLLDAIGDGQWLRAGFWLAVGTVFWAFDRMGRQRGRDTTARGGSR
jgi:hypothetical protein